MTQFLKHKFYGKLFNFLKYKRHKKIKTFLSFNKQKGSFSDLHSNIHLKNRKFFFKVTKLDSFDLKSLTPLSLPLSRSSDSSHSVKSSSFKLVKKKYHLNSFLFNILCNFSKSRSHKLLGQDFFLRYSTIPYRLSLSRFIGNRILFSYYRNLSSRRLSSLHKSISLKAKLSRGNLPFHPHFLPIHSKQIFNRLLFSLENRLDSSLLRLLHFKPLFTKKLVDRSKRSLDSSSSLDSYPSSCLQVKSPWKSFSFSQVKQSISHGHVSINGRSVKSLGYSLRFYDRLALHGFVSNPLWHSPDFIHFSTRSFSHLLPCSFFFRDPSLSLSDLSSFASSVQHDSSLFPTTQSFDSFVTCLPSLFHSFFLLPSSSSLSDTPSPTHSILFCHFITLFAKHFHIKRFSEIFYLTYKNFFFLADSSLFSKRSFLSPTQSSSSRVHHIPFFFQNIGLNQSIYFFWPLLSLLSLQPWHDSSKSLFSSTRSSSRDSFSKDKSSGLLFQKNLKTLLSLKNWQTKLSSLSQSSDSSLKTGRKNLLVNHPLFHVKTNSSWLASFNKSSLDPCYASVVYGTRKCKWVHLQQEPKSNFFGKTYHKLNFFDLELDFFQLSFRHYQFL